MQYQPLLPDRCFHIYNRGNNGENIFLEEKNYPYFLDLMRKHLLPVGDILAYCMLKNHFHLLVRTKAEPLEKNISKAFSNFFNAYAKAINKAYNRTGSLFQDRFKRILIEDEEYIINLVTYIHLNPERHGIANDFRSYSSYKDYLGGKPSIVKKEHILSIFHSVENFKAIHEAKRLLDIDFNSDIDY